MRKDIEHMIEFTSKSNWDTYRANIIPRDVWEGAASFIKRVDVAMPGLPEPDWAPTSDGNICIEWSKNKTDVLVCYSGNQLHDCDWSIGGGDDDTQYRNDLTEDEVIAKLRELFSL